VPGPPDPVRRTAATARAQGVRGGPRGRLTRGGGGHARDFRRRTGVAGPPPALPLPRTLAALLRAQGRSSASLRCPGKPPLAPTLEHAADAVQDPGAHGFKRSASERRVGELREDDYEAPPRCPANL